MTDPLLTIEDATREFRVSPKTIRRRLSSGEIDGAYKRPGSRGPEWVMPRQSLAAAGFVPRPLAAPSTLPSDADERAAYWERRAVDAEAALRAAQGVPPTARRRNWRSLGWAFLAVSLLIVVIAGLIVLRDDGGDEPAPEAVGAMLLVVELLERETEPGDAIGLAGERRTDALPSGRVAAGSPRSGWKSSATGPRFVVATFADEVPPPSVEALRASSEVVLRAPHAGRVVEVYDRRSPANGGTPAVSSPPTAAPHPAPSVEAPVPSVGPATPSATPAEAHVQVGESFWSIAEDVVTAELGVETPDTTVTSYWAALVGANADRLVDPGNPDLLHVGQAIVLPPLT